MQNGRLLLRGRTTLGYTAELLSILDIMPGIKLLYSFISVKYNCPI